MIPGPPSFPGPGGAAPAITPVPAGAPPLTTAPPPGVAPLPGSASQFTPRLEPNWQPAEARTEAPSVAQAGPDPLLGQPNSNGYRGNGGNGNTLAKPTPPGPKLYPPEVQEKSTAEPPLIEEKRTPGAPPSVAEKRSTASFPAGIAQFAQAIPGVTGGLRPAIHDGLDWLKERGYKTVLHLRARARPTALTAPRSKSWACRISVWRFRRRR